MAPPAPLISQYDDINPEQFCNGDNRPANCGQNCMCTHKVDIPLNAVVEVVLVDEGTYTAILIIALFNYLDAITLYPPIIKLLQQSEIAVSSRTSIYFCGN